MPIWWITTRNSAGKEYGIWQKKLKESGRKNSRNLAEKTQGIWQKNSRIWKKTQGHEALSGLVGLKKVYKKQAWFTSTFQRCHHPISILLADLTGYNPVNSDMSCATDDFTSGLFSATNSETSGVASCSSSTASTSINHSSSSSQPQMAQHSASMPPPPPPPPANTSQSQAVATTGIDFDIDFIDQVSI